jgi:hypothetical protein
VLEQLGIRNSVPTGCPSLLLAGPNGPSISIPDDLSFETTCLHATRHSDKAAKPFEEHLYRLAYGKNMDIVLQSETPDIYLALAKQAPERRRKSFSEILIKTYGEQDLGLISAYLQAHGRAFTNFDAWISYMRTKRFCFGTRIHGTIASLIAGTPATLIAHDSRTLEMAQSMSIPYILQAEFERLDSDDLSRIIRPGEITAMSSKCAGYWDRFLAFFASNALSLMPM